MRRRIWLALAVAVLVAVSFAAASAVARRGRDPRPAHVTHGLDYLHARQVDNGGFSTADNTTWAILGAVASGERMGSSAWSRKSKNPFEYLQSISHESAATSASVDNPVEYYARAILAYVAVDQEERIGSAGTPSVDLLTKLYAYQDTTETSGTHGAFSPQKSMPSQKAAAATAWAILAMYACNADNETGGTAPVGATRYAIAVDWLAAQQSATDGGFPESVGTESDVVDTALAIQALSVAPSGAVDDSVLAAARSYLVACENQDGAKGARAGFPLEKGGSVNAEATSSAIQAILALGERPEDDPWKVGEKTPITALATLQRKNGAYRLTRKSTARPMAVTGWALVAYRRKPFTTFPKSPGDAEKSFRFRPNLKSVSPHNGAKYTSRTVIIKAKYTDFTPKGTGIDVDKTRVYVDNSNRSRPAKIGRYSLSLLLKNVPNGSHTYKITLVDRAGNQKTITRSFTVNYTAPAPTSTPTTRPTVPSYPTTYPTAPTHTTKPRTPTPAPTPTTSLTPSYPPSTSPYPYGSPSPGASGAPVTGSPLPSPSGSPSAGAKASSGGGSAAGYVGGTLLAMLPIGAALSYLALHRREEILDGASQGTVLTGGGSAWERFKATLAKSKDLTRPSSRS